ncbi:hypothetical protein ALC53_14021 [Atta colombica]|uniref:Uncharacterized protein n=1 Tax=Atta colombica TaxID=520822 RepID=A0A195AU58_9HYME|nr:hypothetical protein ALC53_14020 [Atta colombica]KYM75593.1 hypothetical protein ALC53_14021 [Atta colombica]
MNEPQPVRRVALFASVLRECPVRDVNHILRGGGGLEDIRHRWSNLAVNIIFYLCKINLFLLVFKSFNLTLI